MRRWTIFVLALLLSACGGGDNGTGSSQVSPGTYRGTATFTVIVATASQAFSSPIVIVVSPDQFVTVGSLPSVPLSGTHFATSLPATAFNQPGSGLNCTQGTFIVEGTFSGLAVSGPISSADMRCNGFPVTIAGSYSATLQPAEQRRDHAAGDLLDALRDAVRRTMPGR